MILETQEHLEIEAGTPVNSTTPILSAIRFSAWVPTLLRPAVDAVTAPECTHPYLNKWGELYHCMNPACCNCEITDPNRIEMERELERITPVDHIPVGISSGKLSQERGVTIGFLLDFTTYFNCWDWTSWEVIRRIIKPATETLRCRFVELDEMREIVGPAHTFISYAQAGKWGDLVAAVLDGGADKLRRIWIDIFAVRQWPSDCPDLDFGATIEHCQSFLIVCQPSRSVSEMYFWDQGARRSELLPKSEKRKIAFYRVWCLAECCKAVSIKGMPVIIKCGDYEIIDDTEIYFKVNSEALYDLSLLVDIRQAEATVWSDYSYIMEQIELVYGLDDLNKIIRGALHAAFELSRNKVDLETTVQCAACGDREAFLRVLEDPKSIIAVSAGGYIRLLEDMQGLGYVTDVSVCGGSNHGTALLYAASSGNIDMVRFLIDLGADVNARDMLGDTPLERAAKLGHSEMCELLINKGANVHSKDDNGTGILFRAAFRGDAKCAELLLTHGINVHDVYALTKAAEHGHYEFLDVLIKHGVDVNLVDNSFQTPLMYSAKYGHDKCVKLLLDNKADANYFHYFSGETALMKTAREGRDDILEILIAAGADIRISTKREGMTAYAYASKFRHQKCVDILLQASLDNQLYEESVAASIGDVILCKVHNHSLRKMSSVALNAGHYTCDVCKTTISITPGESGVRFHCELCGFDAHPSCCIAIED